jgi:energy-coupling factor transporter ATP-binding protein EcfA2
MTYTLEWRPEQEQDEIAEDPFDIWRSLDGDVSALFHRTPDGFHVRFLGCGDFEIDLESRKVICTPVPDYPEDSSENIFANQIVPLLWTYDGRPVLHGSAVVIDGDAFAFLGPSGRGKSTMAAAFARSGYAFLTDDGLVLYREGNTFFADPHLSSIRLLPDSELAVMGTDTLPDDGSAGKVRVHAGPMVPYASQRARLRGIYLMREPNSPEMVFQPLSIAERVDALLQHSFLLDSKDKKRVRGHFEAMGALADGCPMFGLDYPRDYSRLDDTISAIAAHARHVVAQDER